MADKQGLVPLTNAELDAMLGAPRGPQPLGGGAAAANPREPGALVPLDEKAFDDMMAQAKQGTWNRAKNIAFGATLAVPWKIASFSKAVLDNWKPGENKEDPLGLKAQAQAPEPPRLGGPGPQGLKERYDAFEASRDRSIAEYDKKHDYAGVERVAAAIPATIAATAVTPGLNALRGAGMVPRILANAMEGAEAGALMTSVTGGELAENTGKGALGGFGFGVAGAGARAGLGAALRATIDPENLALAQRASELGLNLRPGQISMNRFVQGLDAKLNSKLNAGQLEDLDAALLTTIGLPNETRITPEALNRARQMAGGTLDAVGARTMLNVDQEYEDGLEAVFNLANSLEDTERAPIMRLLEQINAPIGAQIPGMTYQRWTRNSSTLGNMMRNPNANIREAAVMMRDMLDGALERSVGADEVGLVQEARDIFRNASVLERALRRGGSNPVTGQIDPKKLADAVSAASRGYGWGDPHDELQTLARAGLVLPPPTLQGGVKQAAMRMVRPTLQYGLAGAGGAAAATLAGGGAPLSANAMLAAGAGAGAYAGARKIAGSLLASPATAQAVGIRQSAVPGLRPNLMIAPAVGAEQQRRQRK